MRGEYTDVLSEAKKTEFRRVFVCVPVLGSSEKTLNSSFSRFARISKEKILLFNRYKMSRGSYFKTLPRDMVQLGIPYLSIGRLIILWVNGDSDQSVIEENILF